MIDGYCAKYKYEQNIIDFVNTFPIEGQELFWNRCAGQKVSPNISDECYGCEHYKKRETLIKEMDRNVYEKYKKYIIAKLHIEKYKDLFD